MVPRGAQSHHPVGDASIRRVEALSDAGGVLGALAPHPAGAARCPPEDYDLPSHSIDSPVPDVKQVAAGGGRANRPEPLPASRRPTTATSVARRQGGLPHLSPQLLEHVSKGQQHAHAQ